MAKSIAISLEVNDNGTVVVKKFSNDTVKEVKSMSDKSVGHVEKLSAKFTKGLGGAVSGVGRALTSLKTLAVGALAGWGVTQVLGEFATFESALVDMGKVTSESYDSIKNKIMELPPELGSATELTRGYYQVISAGVEGAANQLDTLTTSSKLAKTAHADQAEVITGLTSIMDSFGVESMAAAEAMQMMEKTGKTTVAGLIPVIGELSSGSAALGIDLDEMSAAFSAVTLSSGGTEKAATQYKALLTSLLAPTQGMTDLLAKYGGAQNAIKEIGFGGVLKLIKDETGGNAEATKKLVGSVEAYLGFLSASGDNMATYNSNLEEQKDKTGSVDKAWKDYTATLNAMWETFKNTIGKQVIEIGEKLAPAIKKVIKITGDWLAKNKDFITLKFEDWINGALEGMAGFIEGAADVVEGLYGLKSAVHEATSFLAAMGAVLVDVAAALLLLDPINAYQAAVHGFRDTFPVLAEMRDKFDALGVSQAESALKAQNSQEKFAGYADKMRDVAADVRALTTTQDKMGTSIGTVTTASTNAVREMADKVGKDFDYIDGKWVEISETFKDPILIGIDDQATVPIQEIQTKAEAMQDVVGKSIIMSVDDKATNTLKNIQEEIAKIKDKTVTITIIEKTKVNTEFIGEGSDAKPLTEKASEMTSVVTKYGDTVNAMDIVAKTQFNAIGAGDTEMPASDAMNQLEKGWRGCVESMETNIAAPRVDVREIIEAIKMLMELADWLAVFTSARLDPGSYATMSRYKEMYDKLFEKTMGSFATGTDYVPKTGPYQLHQGEIVIDPVTADRIRNTKTIKNTNTNVGDVHIHVPASAAPQNAQDWRSITRDVIIPELKRAAYN